LTWQIGHESKQFVRHLTFHESSGEVVFRVSGWLDGKRIRKNFPTRAEADAERQILEVQQLQGDTGTRTAITRLTEEQLGEAEAVFGRMTGQPRSLSFYVDFALTNYREPERQRSLADAVADYIGAKEHEFAQDQISAPQMARIRMDLKRLNSHFAGKTVADLTVSSLVAFLGLGRPGMKTHNNRRASSRHSLSSRFTAAGSRRTRSRKCRTIASVANAASRKPSPSHRRAPLWSTLRPSRMGAGCRILRSASLRVSARRAARRNHQAQPRGGGFGGGRHPHFSRGFESP